MLLIALIIAVFAPRIAPYDPYADIKVGIMDIYAPPSAQHLLGTDDAGRDVLSNFIYGARVSLIVGFFAAFISVVIGGLIGISAGFYGGKVELILMRFTDIMLVIPALPLAVVLVALTSPSLGNIIFVIGILGWTTTARLVRSQTLSVKERKFVLRARSIGSGNAHIIRRHIFPLVLPLMVANSVLVISLAILEESTLSFLRAWGSNHDQLGADAQFCLYPRRGKLRCLVGIGDAGIGNRLGSPGVDFPWSWVEQIFNPRLEAHHLSVGKNMVAREKEGAGDVPP